MSLDFGHLMTNIHNLVNHGVIQKIFFNKEMFIFYCKKVIKLICSHLFMLRSVTYKQGFGKFLLIYLFLLVVGHTRGYFWLWLRSHFCQAEGTVGVLGTEPN